MDAPEFREEPWLFGSDVHRHVVHSSEKNGEREPGLLVLQPYCILIKSFSSFTCILSMRLGYTFKMKTINSKDSDQHFIDNKIAPYAQRNIQHYNHPYNEWNNITNHPCSHGLI